MCVFYGFLYIVTILVCTPIILFVVWIAGLAFFPITCVLLLITINNYIGYFIIMIITRVLEVWGIIANGKKLDIDNLDLNRSYTLEEFEFINDQLKTRTLKIEGQPVNLFDLNRNGKLIPMPQAPYYIEKVVTVIATQLQNWNIQTGKNGGVTSSQGGFDFDVGGGKTIRAPDIAYTPKEIEYRLDARQKWSFKGDPFTPLLVIEVGNILSRSKFEEMDRKFKDVYFAEGTSVQLGWLIDPENQEIHVYRRGRPCFNHGWKNVSGGDLLPKFILQIWKIEHAISQLKSVSPVPDNNTPYNCPVCSKNLTGIYELMQHIENNHVYEGGNVTNI